MLLKLLFSAAAYSVIFQYGLPRKRVEELYYPRHRKYPSTANLAVFIFPMYNSSQHSCSKVLSSQTRKISSNYINFLLTNIPGVLNEIFYNSCFTTSLYHEACRLVLYKIQQVCIFQEASGLFVTSKYGQH